MPGLAAGEVLDALEVCRSRHPLDAALFLTCLADPTLGGREAGELGIGDRDRRLLQLRAETFGPRFEMSARCPACDEALEVRLELMDLLVDESVSDPAAGVLEVDGKRWWLRRPDSHDLAAVVDIADPEEGRRHLARRCLLSEEGVPPREEELTRMVLARAAESLSRLDPQADLYASLDCPTCGYAWEAPFDIGLVLVREVEASAQRVLSDVHTLAVAYHWAEADILALSPARRHAYLDLVRS
ncbi:MAG: hypothetical protein ABT940_08615 [Alphaproteobacteria bacterium]